jgi:hypothetical protein
MFLNITPVVASAATGKTFQGVARCNPISLTIDTTDPARSSARRVGVVAIGITFADAPVASVNIQFRLLILRNLGGLRNGLCLRGKSVRSFGRAGAANAPFPAIWHHMLTCFCQFAHSFVEAGHRGDIDTTWEVQVRIIPALWCPIPPLPDEVQKPRLSDQAAT